MDFFQIINKDLFKPLTSKYKETILDCLLIIYRCYKDEMSYGVDRDIVVNELERYFEMTHLSELVFEEESEVATDARSQATSVIRKLKETGWIEYEQGPNYSVKINLLDYASTLLDTFESIIRDDEMEYQSMISQIHGTLLNAEAYTKPYEYIILSVSQSTEALMKGLKKLNTNIKKYIDDLTNDKSANEIVEDFFLYHKDIGSKAYHRIKTSDNISYFRATIQEKLYELMEDRQVFDRAIQGLMLVEEIDDSVEAEILLREKIMTMIIAFERYDEVIEEIDDKNSRYIASAVARAKFLLNNMNNVEGKLIRILNHIAEEFNEDEELSLYDEAPEILQELISIFPQRYLDGDSLYVMPIKKDSGPPEQLNRLDGISQEERVIRKALQRERDRHRFSRKNINRYVDTLLNSEGKTRIRASELELNTKRDLIRLIFISLYGRDPKTSYKVVTTEDEIEIEFFRYKDYWIERG